ncbi:flagellar basal body P-ring formation chaperone FlgA [Vibrio mediterranei]|uniref:flagellar basal body P-ring formation chaperone FlgA n=1 Tax=Vibrio mediterranei TaxID=689 RepID=UPI0040679919
MFRRFLFIGLLCNAFAVQASNTISYVESRLAKDLKHSIEKELGVGVKSVSVSLRVPRLINDKKCDKESLTYTLPNRLLGSSSVRLSCSSPSAWRTRAAVETSVIVSLPHLISAKSQGDTLSTKDWEYKQITLSQSKDLITTPNKQFVALRRLSGGLVSARHVRPIFDIEKGHTIKAVIQSRGIKVETDAIAQEQGNIGEVIKVINSSSGQELRAEVITATTVLVK